MTLSSLNQPYTAAILFDRKVVAGGRARVEGIVAGFLINSIVRKEPLRPGLEGFCFCPSPDRAREAATPAGRQDRNRTMSSYDVLESQGKPIKAWTRGVPIEDAAMAQLRNVAGLPFVHSHIAVMPDVHWGKGATVGSVIPTVGAIIPAAVGVDIGCGMMAVKTTIRAEHLPDDLGGDPLSTEAAVPHGRLENGGQGLQRLAVRPPAAVLARWADLEAGSPPWSRSIRRPRTRAGSGTWARWAQATTSSRSVSMKTGRCG